MALFKKDKETGSHTPAPSDPIRPPTAGRPGGGQSVIGRGLKIEGDITGDDELLVEGNVTGKINTTKTVTIGQSGEVNADVHGETVIVLGRVLGNISASQKVMMKPSAKVTGNITCPSFIVNEGAAFEGSIQMESGARKGGGGNPYTLPPQTPKPASDPNRSMG